MQWRENVLYADNSFTGGKLQLIITRSRQIFHWLIGKQVMYGNSCTILKIAIAEISRYRNISVIIHRKSPITMQRARRTSEFIKIKSSSTSGQFGLPPLLRNLVKPTSIYRARWASSFNEEALRWSSLTPTISSPCSLYSSFSLTCMKFCKHLPYMKM